MKKITGYVKDYFAEVDKRILSLSTFFIAVGIFINYYYGLNNLISTFEDGKQYLSWYLVFLVAFSFAYIVLAIIKQTPIFKNYRFIILLAIAPAIFAWKMSYNVKFALAQDAFENAYWNQVIYWPFKLLVFVVILFFLWKLFEKKESFYGMTFKNFNAKPYWIMLLMMVPLVAAASTQPDFLAMYPKLKNVMYLSGEQDNGFYKLLYELSYGSDFIGIELFFRGFLILAFVKFAGKDAIIPMALFYCTIHFGKPLAECISSFFGGLILGVVTYHTRTIYGGLMVHLGIAWLMELGGYLSPLSPGGGT